MKQLRSSAFAVAATLVLVGCGSRGTKFSAQIRLTGSAASIAPMSTGTTITTAAICGTISYSIYQYDGTNWNLETTLAPATSTSAAGLTSVAGCYNGVKDANGNDTKIIAQLTDAVNCADGTSLAGSLAFGSLPAFQTQYTYCDPGTNGQSPDIKPPPFNFNVYQVVSNGAFLDLTSTVNLTTIHRICKKPDHVANFLDKNNTLVDSINTGFTASAEANVASPIAAVAPRVYTFWNAMSQVAPTSRAEGAVLGTGGSLINPFFQAWQGRLTTSAFLGTYQTAAFETLPGATLQGVSFGTPGVVGQATGVDYQPRNFVCRQLAALDSTGALATSNNTFGALATGVDPAFVHPITKANISLAYGLGYLDNMVRFDTVQNALYNDGVDSGINKGYINLNATITQAVPLQDTSTGAIVGSMPRASCTANNDIGNVYVLATNGVNGNVFFRLRYGPGVTDATSASLVWNSTQIHQSDLPCDPL